MSNKCNPIYMTIAQTYNNEQITKVVPVYCGSWDCPRCRCKKSYKVRKFIKDRFRNKQLYMITLTFKRNLGAEETWQEMGKCWNRLRTTIAKHTNNFRYIRIVEPHKREGYPHFHILTDTFIPANVLTKNVTLAGFGFIMHRTRMSCNGAEVYLSKYLTKEWKNEEAAEFRRKTGARIISASLNLGAVFSCPSTWDMVDIFFKQITAREANVNTITTLRNQGHTNIRMQKEEELLIIISSPPKLEKPTYLQTEDEIWESVRIHLNKQNPKHKLYS